MSNEINRPFFLAALIAWFLVVLVEIGSSFLPVPDITAEQLSTTIQREKEPDQDMPEPDELREMARQRNEQPPRPGFAITSLIAFDAIAFLGFFWMGARLVISRKLAGRLQGITSLIVSIVILVLGMIAAFVIFALLMVMLGLFLAVPFGTLAYLAIWGFFPRSEAAATLGILMFLKLATAVLLVLAQRDFIKNKGLMLLLGLSLLLNMLTTFLHNFPPGILVSITDAIAALIILIVAIIWALILLIGSLVATIKALKPEKG
jgi:hypothetical protein